MKDIVEFIIDDSHPAPFLVHCRLGTDRTGVVSGMLAALVGTPWNDIAADYQLTNQMGIGEFRDYGLLNYSLTQMLGTAPDNAELDLQTAVQNYFISNGYLTQEQIDLLVSKLTKVNDLPLE